MDVAKNSLGLPLLNDLDDLFMDYVEGLENLAGELPLLDMDNLSKSEPPESFATHSLSVPVRPPQ